MLRWITGLLLSVCLICMIGCTTTTKADASAVAPTKAAEVTSPNSTNEIKTETKTVKTPQLLGIATVELKLKYGTVIMEIDGKNAPVTAGNFIDLVQRGFYNGLTFHRIVKEPTPFVAQGGDPDGRGTGNFIDPTTKQPRYIPLEILAEGADTPTYSAILPAGKKPKLQHIRGAVAMARTPAPDSASCQFYIALGNINFLDGQYAVFGYVKSGMEFVDQIKMGDKIESAKVTQGAENFKA